MGSNLSEIGLLTDDHSVGVHLTGQMNGWTTPKDLILHLAGKLTVRVSTFVILWIVGISSLICCSSREERAQYWSTSALAS